MLRFEFIKEDKVAVFTYCLWAKDRRLGSIVKLGEKQWQYVTTCGSRGEVFASLGLVKRSLIGDDE